MGSWSVFFSITPYRFYTTESSLTTPGEIRRAVYLGSEQSRGQTSETILLPCSASQCISQSWGFTCQQRTSEHVMQHTMNHATREVSKYIYKAHYV